jgi:hypothetical protein
MKLRILKLAGCFVAGVIGIVILYYVSNESIHNPNGFIRMLPSHKIIGINSLDITYNSFYLAGADTKHIYMANTTSPGVVLRTSMSLTGTIEMKLTFEDSVKIFKGSYISIDSPKIYLMDGVKPAVYQIDFSNLKYVRQVNTPFFTNGISISQNSFVFRSVDSRNENILLKMTADSPFFKTGVGLLQKQVDGIFCTDGILIKDPGLSKIVYVYYYRNQFICMDTNLNLLYRGKTIDTVSYAHISVATIASGRQTVLSSPPLMVNKQSSANEDWLFVHSALRADNETQAVMDAVSIIDVYSLKDGKYYLSFYLPDFRGKKIRDFKVFGNTLVALYDHYIYTYHLNF